MKDRDTRSPTENHVSIDSIQAHITSKFKKLKYPVATIEFDIQDLDKFAIAQSSRLRLDEEYACERIRDVWWAIASVQLSLGYMIVAKDSAEHPRGSKQSVYEVGDLEVDFNIGDLHFWYHCNMAAECVYRVWERLANMLKFFCKITEDEKRLYYDGVIEKLKEHCLYADLSAFKLISSQVKHWNKVSGHRNRLSHQLCRLMGKDNIEVVQLPILKIDGTTYSQLTAESPDLFQEIDKIKNMYIQARNGLKNTIKFVAELPNN